jgi:hypothetical protein
MNFEDIAFNPLAYFIFWPSFVLFSAMIAAVFSVRRLRLSQRAASLTGFAIYTALAVIPLVLYWYFIILPPLDPSEDYQMAELSQAAFVLFYLLLFVIIYLFNFRKFQIGTKISVSSSM